jgi:Protein of unknown function (DUF2439)
MEQDHARQAPQQQQHPRQQRPRYPQQQQQQHHQQQQQQHHQQQQQQQQHRQAAPTAAQRPPARSQQLRCMFTQQKTKKHKTWKDGVVVCCPTKFSVTLFKWSDTLHKTGAALAEVYLSEAEYKAFTFIAGASLVTDSTCKSANYASSMRCSCLLVS